MPTTEWHVPFDLQTTLGTFQINQGFPGFFLDQTKCSARRRIRAETDDIPQGDGEIFHTRYAGGYEMTLNGQAWVTQNEMMCTGTEELVDLRDELYGHLWALLHPPDDGGRIIWTPTGKANRMLDGILLLDVADPEISDIGVVTFEFTVDTRFPYAIDEAQTVETIDGIGSITNGGNVEFWPVIKMYADGGTIYNHTTDKFIDIHDGCLAGGSYIEIDTFRMTAYVNGDGANAKPCVDVILTEFFPIVPGVNTISTDVTCEFLMNNSWA